ncbi:MAG: cytochrome c3 family protein [Acidobacteria bacterium]|nr:cytochrome c3 family protein [Acidobacteriota bacterium]
MAQIFPRWTNRLPALVIGGALPLVGLAAGAIGYYASPEFTDVGYRPVQPIPYSHKLHAGELGIDCRYCHARVEVAAAATLPPTKVCMNCHASVARDSVALEPLRESVASGTPIEWVRIHRIPDYAYFDHGVHIRAGVGCSSCHGAIHEMEVVQQAKPLSMGWCLDCHRNPEMHLRPLDEVTDMDWAPPTTQMKMAAQFRKERKINPSTDCSACHR